jgi:ABC-type phosphate/phosphonate transport system substrate-binding protein
VFQVFRGSAVVLIALLSILNIISAFTISAGESSQAKELTLVVMDPMAAPLACDCVKGYAQRKYESLGAFLNKQLGCKINVVWAGSLEAALEKSEGKADLIIGKHSVVLSDAAESKIEITPVAQLTDLKDRVVQTGLIVVRKDDAAKSVDDLKGYRILFGPADCDEKSAAPVELLRKHGIQLPDELETSPSCSNAAVALMEMPATSKAAAVISSYAEPLLEGCGKVKKGDLRVIGESKPVPFITLFARTSLSANELSKLSDALDEAGLDAQLLIDLETASGFVPWKEAVATSSVADDAKKK